MNIQKFTEKAKHSAFHLKVLNFGISRLVPFNKPHGFRIVEISDTHLKTLVPYRKANFNHIRGIHACALATLSEYTTGFLLLTRLDPKKYRLIMERIEIDYHYQAKMDSYATFQISKEWLEEYAFQPLKSSPKISLDCEVLIHDRDGNHISTAVVRWQVKSWKEVKTKV